MILPRIVQPELLDSLPSGHPDALASRRDLRLINALMGNFRWIARELRAHLRPGEQIVEPGAGDGTLGRTLRARFPGTEGHYAAVDLASRPSDWPVEFRWVQADLLAAAGAALLASAEVVIANLFLHHFGNDQLGRIGELLGKARVLIVSEPARREIHLRQGRLLAPLAQLNRVTRHDLAVSVRAGFLGDELPAALELDPAWWRWRTRSTWLGAYRLVALRDPS